MIDEAALSLLPPAEKEELLALLEEQERRGQVRAARSDLLSFARMVYPGFKVGGHHRIIGDVFKDVVEGRERRVIINIAPRMGKQLSHDTPVLTTQGWKTHGTLVPGDYVFHPSGKPVRVLGLSHDSPSDVRVEFFDGSVFWCHENHEWTLWNMSRKRYETVETGAFLRPRKGRWGATEGKYKQVLSGGRALHCLPAVSALRFPAQELPLHPYVLGAWLGDGSTAKPCFSHSTDDQPYIDKIIGCGLQPSARWVHATTGVVTTSFGRTGLTPALRALGIYNNKRIPRQYLHSSIEQRLELLAGLIDTDGHVDVHSRCGFTTGMQKLAEDVVELVRSFGWRVSVHEYAPRLSSSGVQGKAPYWLIAFQPGFDIPTVLPRKRIRRFADKRRIGLKSVTRDPQGKAGRCITVDSPDGLYLVGHALIPTHNSEFSSYLFPPWFLGRFPDKKVIMATHTAGLSEDFGRRIRNLLDDDIYRTIFQNTVVAPDQKSAGKWSTTVGGQYYAVGVGGALAGRGADLLVIDDPVSEQAVMTNSTLAFETAWNWFQTGPLQRLMPGGAIVVIMCMTGDTPVLLADGMEKPLRDIRPGDVVATYEDGKLAMASVRNWRSSGVDDVFTVRTQSGKLLRANERHPFLVDDEGVRKWIRLKDLKPGMCLVATKAAVDRRDHKQSPDCATRVKPETRTTRSILTRLSALLGTTESGRAKHAVTTDAHAQSRPEGCVHCTTQSGSGHQDNDQRRTRQKNDATAGSSRGMASRKRSLTRFYKVKGAFARCVASLLHRATPVRIGTASCVLTTSTPLDAFEGCFATTATSLSDTQEQWKLQTPWRDTSGFTTDRIVEILPSGREEVFDIEVERTGNFIANGVVSHNTRWSQIDLTGRLLKYADNNPDSPPWKLIELPAIIDGKDSAGNAVQKSLWPEQWPLQELLEKKAGMDARYWNAQYMQRPTATEAQIIKRDWWRVWPKDKPPACKFILHSIDPAFEAKTSADYTAFTCWGVFEAENDKDDGRVVDNIILLDAWKARIEFPELKRSVINKYKEWQPDTVLIEKKASGAPLIQELRLSGYPVSEFTPSRGKAGQSNDKTARLNAVSDLFSSGRVWIPDKRWAWEVVDEVASFPVGENDDYVDSTSQAMLRIRQGGLIALNDNALDTDEIEYVDRPRSRRFYGMRG